MIDTQAGLGDRRERFQPVRPLTLSGADTRVHLLDPVLQHSGYRDVTVHEPGRRAPWYEARVTRVIDSDPDVAVRRLPDWRAHTGPSACWPAGVTERR
jgi:hypothetical protein